VFTNRSNWLTRHRTTVVDYETEVLLNLLLGSPLSEEFTALKELDMHDDLVLVCYLILEGAKKLVISSRVV
jgi:hypothetical protein